MKWLYLVVSKQNIPKCWWGLFTLFIVTGAIKIKKDGFVSYEGGDNNNTLWVNSVCLPTHQSVCERSPKNNLPSTSYCRLQENRSEPPRRCWGTKPQNDRTLSVSRRGIRKSFKKNLMCSDPKCPLKKKPGRSLDWSEIQMLCFKRHETVFSLSWLEEFPNMGETSCNYKVRGCMKRK